MNYSRKLKTIVSLKRITAQLRKRGRKIVFTNGCFDILHPGHIKALKKAKSKGDILIVALNSDRSVKKIKGPKRPILNQKERIEIISSLECIDYVILFDEPTPYALIAKLRPHILVKGGDWKHNAIVGKDLVDKVFKVKLAKGYSTTSLIKRILKKYPHGT